MMSRKIFNITVFLSSLLIISCQLSKCDEKNMEYKIAGHEQIQVESPINNDNDVQTEEKTQDQPIEEIPEKNLETIIDESHETNKDAVINAMEEKIRVDENDKDTVIEEAYKEVAKEENISNENDKQSAVPLREILQKLTPASLLEEGDEQKNITPIESENVTAVNTTDSKNATEKRISQMSKQVLCEELYRDPPLPDVELIDSTTLLKILQSSPGIYSRSEEAKCCLIYFYSPYCHFSTAGTPYVNGLARSLINIPVYGLDSVKYHNLNGRYGVVGTPSLLLFHNGVESGRYNASEFSTSSLLKFINFYTTENLEYINVTFHDFEATLPSTTIVTPDYTLYFSWAFLISCALWKFAQSETFAKMTELFLNNWREAEAAQHAHQE